MAGSGVELKSQFRTDYTIMEEAPTVAFTFKTLLEYTMLNGCLNTIIICK